jgi:hypothetical protein
MKNKFILSILAALGLAAANNGNSQGYGPVTFVDVATLGDGVTVVTGAGGTVNVDATVLTKSQRWNKEKVYLLERNVIIPSGITLTIEQGTLLRGARPSKGQGASGAEAALSPADPGALVCARGGRLIIAGTADAPVIFTSMDDPHVPGGAATIPPFENRGIVAGTGIINPERVLKTIGSYTTVYTSDARGVGYGEFIISGGTLTASAQAYGDDLTQSSSKWSVDAEFGGIVICGYAETVVGVANNTSALTTAINNGSINNATGSATGTSGVQLVEGMAAFSAYGLGGGDNESDDSGIIRFVDLRYGGYIIAAGKELNSFSFYGVGKNTVTEFLADWNNADDSFEMWGGSVNLRHCISAFPGDDGLDTDQGYTGTVQFYVQLQNNAVDANGNLSRRALVNVGDSQSENDGPESGNQAVPYSVYTLANATFIGRGYNSIAERFTEGTGAAATTAIEPATGLNYKDNGSAKVYNSLFMDSPHGAMLVMDRNAVGFATAPTSAGNSSINRFTVARNTGGFDAAGRASDLVTAQTGAPGERDGLFNNVWFYRSGLLDTGSLGVNGKYTSLAALVDDVSANPSTYWKAADSALFPDRTARTERGASTNGAALQANRSEMITVVKASNGVKFDQDPGVAVPLNHHLSGIDIKPSNTAARDLAVNQLPNYDTAGSIKTTRSLVTGAAFVGAVRDSSWFRGWNFASQSGCFANSAVAIVPTVTVAKTAEGNPLVNFGAETGVKYSLEVSTDNKSFVPVTVLESANLPYTDTSKTVGTTALYYRAIAM